MWCVMGRHSTACRRTAADKSPRCARPLTTFTPSWRSGRERWPCRSLLSRRRSWTTSAPSRGSTQNIWTTWARSWRPGSTPWTSLRWPSSCRWGCLSSFQLVGLPLDLSVYLSINVSFYLLVCFWTWQVAAGSGLSAWFPFYLSVKRVLIYSTGSKSSTGM